MSITKKIILSALVVSALGFYSIALAQATTTQNSASQEIQSDSQVTAQDLGVQEPSILPNSPFYFLKEWGRGITSFFTFDATKKAELANKYANEKLIELQKLAENNASAQDIKDAVANYENSINDLNNKISQVQDKSANNQELTNFLTDFDKQQILQEEALRTIITDQVSTDVSNVIKNAEDTQIKNFGTIVSDLQQAKQDVRTQILDAVKNLPGSQLKDFSTLELLNNIGQNATGTTGQMIQSITDTVQQNLQETLKNLPVIEQQKIQDYLQNIPGDKGVYNDVLKNVAPIIQGSPELTKNLINAEQNLRNSIIQNTQNMVASTTQNVRRQIQQNLQNTLQNTQNIVASATQNAQQQLQQNLQNTLQNTQNTIQDTVPTTNNAANQVPLPPTGQNE